MVLESTKRANAASAAAAAAARKEQLAMAHTKAAALRDEDFDGRLEADVGSSKSPSPSLPCNALFFGQCALLVFMAFMRTLIAPNFHICAPCLLNNFYSTNQGRSSAHAFVHN